MKKYYYSIGKRKNAVAQIYLRKTKNNYSFKINKKDINLYFKNNIYYLNKIDYPFILTNNLKNNFNININVKGGGLSGQTDSIILALSRIFCKIDKINFKILKKNKLLTRDSRKVERKKFGRKKSRKKFQFSKR
ncbi:MAG: 30S ribosomal protein S9 [Candidatus Shikimatogenerans bostrichidophilus]|nr:MAG: 30S ribosomal protein S9 [Candidatus Shikimatogenerans bostrichidophilus]